MKVRRAEFVHVPRLTRLGKDFHDHVQPSWPWNGPAFSDFVIGQIEHGFVSVSDGGFFVGTMGPWPLNPTWLVAHELLWWAQDGTGADHFRAFRSWASNADEIRWSCRSSNDRVRAFYKRLGPEIETHHSEVR